MSTIKYTPNIKNEWILYTWALLNLAEFDFSYHSQLKRYVAVDGEVGVPKNFSMCAYERQPRRRDLFM